MADVIDCDYTVEGAGTPLFLIHGIGAARDVWRFLTIDEVADRYPIVRRHLGRKREFWDFLIEGWRRDGLLPESRSSTS